MDITDYNSSESSESGASHLNPDLEYLAVSPVRRKNAELDTKNLRVNDFELNSSLGVAASDYIQLLQKGS